MPTKNKKKAKKIDENTDVSNRDGIVGMMISLHTFPVESEEELEEKKKMMEALKGMDWEYLESKTKQKRDNNNK